MAEEILEDSVLWAESLFGHKTRKGLVRLTYGVAFDVTITPTEARDFALSILGAAEAAEQDEAVWKFLDRVGISTDEQRAAVLVDLRQIRTAMMEEKDGEYICN